MTIALLALTLGLAGAASDSTTTPPAAFVVPAPPDSFLHGLSALGLRRVRVTTDGHRFELKAPSFTPSGVGWHSVDGFQRPRPVVIGHAGSDAAKPPPNPVPWPEVEQLESITGRRGTGALNGALIGFVVVGAPTIGIVTAIEAFVPDANTESVLPQAIGIAALATFAGAVIGHLLIPGTPVWTEIPLPTTVGAERVPE